MSVAVADVGLRRVAWRCLGVYEHFGMEGGQG